jgi:XcyI restriction endonuclease
MSDKKPLPLSPELAINLYENLIEARKLYLHPALSKAIREVGVKTIDTELYRLVPLQALDRMAELGLRGELAFPTPSIIEHTPSLLGYYRMLLGQSKKEFRRKGYGTWINVEENEKLSKQNENELEEYCANLAQNLATLILAMGEFNQRDLSDLALLTLGSTFQGARNDAIGSQAEKQIFELLLKLVKPWIIYAEWPVIRFAIPTRDGSIFEIINKSDPDISLRAGSGAHSGPLLAIEVKGGGDASNAHNRAGEAEKSHIKAASAGYNHRWTLIQIPAGQRDRISNETPSSTRFFEFNEIIFQSGDDWIEFQKEFFKLTHNPHQIKQSALPDP